MTELRLTNTMTRQKEVFTPEDTSNVRLYVCGPTVYDYAHIGNARPAIVFDVLFRLLRHLYGEDHVTYVRNITDVDDKINSRALRDFGPQIEAGELTLNEAIRQVTETTFAQYQKDVEALGCLPPTIQPRATEHIDGMIKIIQALLDEGHAYVANGAEGRETLFDVRSMANYGQLSRRNLDDQKAGARIDVEDHKRNPGDFVLWKESAPTQPGWEAEFTISEENRQALHLNDCYVSIHGRPGWHIECSAMSAAYLGETFDIHGGGLDLIFPHHENEIAQSCCAHGSSAMANYWLHNGFVQVEGRKMSKSEGNFVTIHDLLHTEKFGGRKWPGEVLRLAMLMTHYREPIDFSVRRLEEAANWLERWRRRMRQTDNRKPNVPSLFIHSICDDLDLSKAFEMIHIMMNVGQWAEKDEASKIGAVGFGDGFTFFETSEKIAESIATAAVCLKFLGIDISAAASPEESPDVDDLAAKIDQRLAFIREKNWAEADRIRDELLEQGIQLKDSKDSETGERVTTWEVKR
ncbi:cysteine--tRNA ligase [Notoacmeibacter ruber]|uniref:Cysteine--tRNA ligase n=1 Tax=Notoacmeibacter ruber TaxID=2670375 RepID=A0A3L7JAX5_9HYPH|nr:cysteine--tRNA ligase [Notoacmeibacter ruber]RLQ87604.1 cysteine--tRNA ligase [Notoacmeibacter ruber]